MSETMARPIASGEDLIRCLPIDLDSEPFGWAVLSGDRVMALPPGALRAGTPEDWVSGLEVEITNEGMAIFWRGELTSEHPPERAINRRVSPHIELSFGMPPDIDGLKLWVGEKVWLIREYWRLGCYDLQATEAEEAA